MFQKEYESTGNIKEFALWAADFLDNLPVGMYRTTLEGELVFCNWAFAHLLGYNETTYLHDFKVVELFPHKSERGKFVRQVLDQGNVQHYSMRLLKKSGDFLTCNTSAKAVLNDDGQVIYIDGIMSESEGLPLDTSVNGGPAESSESYPVYLCVDPSGFIDDMNETAANLLGSRPQKNAEQLSLYSFIGSGNRDRLTQLLKSAQKQQVSLDVLPLRDHKGVTRHMECQASAGSEPHERSSIDIICRDISHTIECMRKSQSEERLQGVVEMAGGIAHNMNQPLTVINNLLHDLSSSLSGESTELQDKLSRIQYQLGKLNTIAKKVRSVKQYKSIHYLLGEKIVDIDQLS